MTIAMHIDCVFDIDGIGDSKINELQLPVNKKKIGRFQIGVDDVVGVNSGNACKHLLPVKTCKRNI